jgi:molecular chaperone GrpE
VKKEDTMAEESNMKEDGSGIEEEPAGKDQSNDQGPKEAASGKKDETGKKSRKKGKKKEKDLMDLVQHKNEMLEKMRKKIERLEEDIDNKEDRIIRMVAEFDNYKKRIYREQELQQDKMYADILRELLPVLDDFDRAMETDIEEGNNFFEGIKLVYQGFRDILNRMGLSEIEAAGQNFDPRLHEAMGRIESEEEEGKVAYVVLKGYKYNDMVVRPARVMVSGGAGKDEEESE